MILTPASLQALNVRFGKEFDLGREQVSAVWPDLAMRVPSTTKSNIYGWPTAIPGFREWIGPRIFHNLASRVYQVFNKDWENSFAVPRNDIEDDSFGLYTESSRLLGNNAELLWDDLLVSALRSGTTALAFDGQYVFDTDHPVNMDDLSAGIFSNKLAATDLTAANLAAVAAIMRGFKGEGGRMLKLAPDTLIYPPALATKAALALSATVAVGGVGLPNPYTSVIGGANGIRPLMLDDLNADPDVWYLAHTKRLKPFVLQVRKEADFQSRTAPTFDNVFYRKEFEYGSDARGNVAPTLPHLIIRCSVT